MLLRGGMLRWDSGGPEALPVLEVGAADIPLPPAKPPQYTGVPLAKATLAHAGGPRFRAARVDVRLRPRQGSELRASLAGL
jgi:hypothetical protein